tara:strand:+ start:247 stop:2004 length:1758 start_codon:yes stop_codon:yes gene_type:complete
MTSSKLKKISPLSHSKASSFSNCERKFSFNYLESISEPSSIHAAVGIFVHSVIEEYFKEENNLNPYFNWEQSSNYLDEIYKKLWPKYEKNLNYLYKEQSSKVNNSFSSVEEWTSELINNYIELEDWIQNESDIESLKLPTNLKTVGDLNIENEKYVKKEIISDEDSFTLRGYIDRLQSDSNGNKVIIDIKTGKPPASLDKEKANQIKSYALLYGENDVIAGFIYFLGDKNIKPQKRIFEVPIEDIDENEKFYVSSYKKMINKSNQDIENFNNLTYPDLWSPMINPLCNWCWYKNTCPVWVNKYQNKNITKSLENLYSRLRHSGGLAKQDETTKDLFSNIYSEINRLDMELQVDLERLKSNELNELKNTIKAINIHKKENSISNNAVNKIKKLLDDIGSSSFISQNKELLESYVIKNKKILLEVENNLSQDKTWEILSVVLNNIQNQELVSQLDDLKDEFNQTIEKLRSEWMIWKDFEEIDKITELNIEIKVDNLINFKLFRKDKLKLLEKNSIHGYIENNIESFSKLKKITINDLDFLGESKDQYLNNLHKLSEQITTSLNKLLLNQKAIDDNILKLSKTELLKI